MKLKTFANGHLLAGLLIIGLTIGLVSWDYDQTPGHYKQGINDTVPEKQTDREKKIRDLDDVIDELDRADMKVDMEKMKKELEEAMKQIDGEKIRMQVQKAMKEVDMERLKKEIEESMAKVDYNKIQKEIEEAMKQVDAAKIQQEVKASLEKIDWEKMKAELERVKDIDMSKLDVDMKKMEEELKKIQPELEKSMEKAKKELEKAKAEMREYREFVNGLEKDGLLNKKDGYKIRHKNGELEVNGKKVSEPVYNKYKSFLEKHKTFTIEKTDDDFDIDMD
ncbi:MAG TPA: hypothetical protein PKC72_11665 [Chitinophagaceae bacterium]|nr:hypothetical protein [Chitinophagaceae bacterium]